eukprot:TRINITY_DN293_c0_g1_i1.p1 TRINITY_DN293_c0_g1~~TRINITY_DN293_c0_g1_i1.p1  ORF type:complete len:371 (-),score=99.11 TRINITY_DN293_c0_g1_i1:10-1122(-)
MQMNDSFLEIPSNLLPFNILYEFLPGDQPRHSWIFDLVAVFENESFYKCSPLIAIFGSKLVSNLSNNQVFLRINEKLVNINLRTNDIGMVYIEEMLDDGDLEECDEYFRPFFKLSQRIFFTPDEMDRMDLQRGRNLVSLEINNEGVVSQICTSLFLLDVQDRIVISDIDGTITRSDIAGQVLPRIGKNYSHAGVSVFLQNLSELGYLVIYLSSRPIGDVEHVKSYLFGASDSGLKVHNDPINAPMGPVLLQPCSLGRSFIREMQGQASDFKTAILRTIMFLFPHSINPIIGGIGNRHTDEKAYLRIGIDPKNIMIIDKNNRVKTPYKVISTQGYVGLTKTVLRNHFRENEVERRISNVSNVSNISSDTNA